MDILSIVGIALAFIAILGGNAMEGGHLSSLMQLTAFLIVFGGTSGAILIQTPFNIFMKSLKMALWVVLPPKNAAAEVIQKIVNWSNIARKEGLLGLESLTENEPELLPPKPIILPVPETAPDDDASAPAAPATSE